MGFLHHSHYLSYFEMGRTEMFRAGGGNYRDMEESGLFLVVARMNVQYKAPARYDDLLTLRTTIVRPGPVKLEHEYELFRDGQLLAKAQSVLACIDRQGTIQRIPEM
jgi:acyl-CoA thioester hydrolase